MSFHTRAQKVGKQVAGGGWGVNLLSDTHRNHSRNHARRKRIRVANYPAHARSSWNNVHVYHRAYCYRCAVSVACKGVRVERAGVGVEKLHGWARCQNKHDKHQHFFMVQGESGHWTRFYGVNQPIRNAASAPQNNIVAARTRFHVATALKREGVHERER